MANEFVIKNGYFSQGNSNVTGSLQVTGSVGVTGSVSITQNVTASKALFSSSNNNQLIVIGSGSSSWITGIYGSQGNLLTVTDTMSGSLFTVADISGYPVLKVISDHYTNNVQIVGDTSLTGSLSITQNITASKALFSSSNGDQLTVIGSGSTVAQMYGSQGNLLVVNDTFSGSIFTVTDISGYPILDITSDYYTGSVFLPMMQSQSQQYIVAYNSQSGLLTYMSASVIGGGSSTPPFPYTGSAVITGSLIVSGGFFVYNTSPQYKIIDSTLSNLYYSNGKTSVGWADSQLRDTNEVVSINWNERTLFANNNETIHLNWDNPAYMTLPNINEGVITQVLGIDSFNRVYVTSSTAFGGGGAFNSTSSVIGNGALATWNINHGFNTRNLHITVYESSSNGVTGNGETVYPDIRRINNNTASIVFANPPLTNQYIVYISQ